jgi:phospholipid/cholesterol/gamma-HCH transport system substrate-binding protein
MAWKVNNETKVGAITAISITLLILGFNFLKGKNITKKSRYLYAKFQKIDGLIPADPVQMKGLKIGSVYKAEPGDADLNWVLVTIRLDEDVNIPANSIGAIQTSLLGSGALEIKPGNSTKHLVPGDTLVTMPGLGALGGVMSQLEPTQRNLDHALQSADSVLFKVSQVLDDKAQADLRQTLANLNAVSANLTNTTRSLNSLLNEQTGAVTKAVHNLELFTQSLAQVRGQLPTIVNNLETTTENLSKIELDKTLANLDKAINNLDAILSKANDPSGTIGALINDKKLYNNLNSTINSLNILMQDLRINPKRYVNISVFGGKKGKGDPLMKPLAEDSITLEQKLPQ